LTSNGEQTNRRINCIGEDQETIESMHTGSAKVYIDSGSGFFVSHTIEHGNNVHLSSLVVGVLVLNKKNNENH